MAGKKKVSIEENFEQLDEIIRLLEQEDTTLEDSLAGYTKGMAIIKDCTQILDKVEKKIQILGEEEGQQDEE